VRLELADAGTALVAGVVKTGSTIVHWVTLTEPFIISADNIKSVSVDNIDITNYVYYNQIVVDRPFYQWLHQATGQGWLLNPTKYNND
jgi:hypothetical protein